MGSVAFCSCSDERCPHHPVNHEGGCTPCIAKNLGRGEIPACFWNLVKKGNVPSFSEYSVQAFARLVLEEETV